MGVASLVLGIVSVVFGFVPFCGTWAVIPAIVGLILGIVDLVKKKKEEQPKGKSIAGIVCSSVAIVVIIVWWVIAGIGAREAGKALNSYDWNEFNKTLSSWNTSINN